MVDAGRARPERPRWAPAARRSAARVEREFEVDTGFTGVWARETLRRHGGWDEGWPVDQDFELAARIRAEGGRIVCVPEMAADYIPRNSLRACGASTSPTASTA